MRASDDDPSGPRPLRAVRPPSLQDVVEEKLVEAIVAGHWPDNERLTEVELAERLGVSRSPMRSAMQQLIHDGLLVRSEPRGVRVAPLHAGSAREFYDCRILLEGHCARLAAPELTESHIVRAEDLLTQLHAAHDATHRAIWLDVVEQLHDVYRSACPNRELVAMIHGLGRRTLRFRALGIARPGRMDYSVRQHGRIVAAMRDRDAAALHMAVTELLTTSRDGIVLAIEKMHSATDADQDSSTWREQS